MQITVANRRRGTALAFILMGLIAILAIVVVLLSRAWRDDKVENIIEAPSEVESPTGYTPPAEDFETSPAAAQPATTSTGNAAPVQTPPPPPPIPSLPDKSSLPPEG